MTREWRIIYPTFLLCHPSHPLRFPRGCGELAGAQPLPCAVGSRAATRLRFLPGVQQGKNEAPSPPELLLGTPHPWHSRIPGTAASLVQPHPHHASSTPTTQLLSAFFSIQPRVRTCFKKSPFPTSTGEKKRPQKAQTPKGTFRLAQASLLCLPRDFYTHLVTRGS